MEYGGWWILFLHGDQEECLWDPMGGKRGDGSEARTLIMAFFQHKKEKGEGSPPMWEGYGVN